MPDRRIITYPAARPIAADLSPYARARHARYFEQRVAYHVMARARGNLFLLRPDLEGKQREIFAGVYAEARRNYPSIANCAAAVMSNHQHGMLWPRDGDPRVIADYVGYVSRETTRRWRGEVGWHGSIWETYIATAVVTPAAQLRTLKYILAQSVKEKLVADPREWPGFHCAQSLVSGEPVVGYWFDGTGYGKARHAEMAKKHPREMCRDAFVLPREFTFDKLPAFADMTDAEYRALIATLLAEIVAEGEMLRDGAPPLGAEAVCAMDPKTSAPVPAPPWFEDRKRLVAWDDRSAPEVQEYLERYWEHQVEFRSASRAWREHRPVVVFPELSFVPGLRPRPIAHMEQSAA
jgi:REP element-mobilizing transposase RayT